MSSDDSFSPILTTRRVRKTSPTEVSTPVQSRREIATKLSLTKQRNAKHLQNQENIDPFKTPDTTLKKKVSAAFLFSSCKKKPTENEKSYLPGHTVLVDDSSDEELVKCQSDDDGGDHQSEVVDDSLVEYSLIRKWLQNAEDSSESDNERYSDHQSDSDDSFKLDHRQLVDKIDQPKFYPIDKENTIILSSDNDESFIKPSKRSPISRAPQDFTPTQLKAEPSLCDSFDSFHGTKSLEEKLANTFQSQVQNKILCSSSEESFSPKDKRSTNLVLCGSSDEDEILSSPQHSIYRPKIATGTHVQPTPVCIPESDSELEDIFVTLTINDPPAVKPKPPRKPRQKKKVRDANIPVAHVDPRAPRSFLASLSSDVPAECRHRDAIPFLKNFRKSRDELTSQLFTLFNDKVFNKNLPRDFSITWNSRLTRTAGYCRHFTKRENGMTTYESRIELSVKVVDTPCRLRDTLVHELCHAATWVIDNCRGGHGPVWRKWANQALDVFPELPPITRCHNYEISYKFYYNCIDCKYSAGRHSKSIDTNTHVCPVCRGKLQLSKEPSSSLGTNQESTPKIPKAPRTPNAFALFVKDNYASVKSSRADLPHATVMKLLSAKFAESKKQVG